MPWDHVESPADLVGKHETASFDWKQMYDFTKPTTAFEVAKDVAALASALGGTIVVGAIEGAGARRGMVGAFKSVADPNELVKKVSEAVLQRTRPLPVFEPRIIKLSREEQRAALDREPDVDEVTVVAINVSPLASGPVGVRSCDENGKLIADAWRFPMRGGEGTRFLLPEELALYLSTHDRKIGIQLHRIPNIDDPNAKRPEIRVVDDHRAMNLLREVVRIDDDLLLLELRWDVGVGGSVARAHVPFAFIRAVWRDETGVWCIFVEGFVFNEYRDVSKPQFLPTR